MDIPYISRLVLRAQQNDSDAFAALYALTYNKVYNYARHYLRDDFLAQDAMQEVYILVLKNLPKLNDPTLFIAWLNRITFRVCFDLSKKQSSSSAQPLDTEFADIVEDKQPGSNPELCFQKKDEHQRLMSALEHLPFQEQQVVTMRFFNNMKLEEIADACDISRSSVKRYLSQGQKKLRELLNG